MIWDSNHLKERFQRDGFVDPGAIVSFDWSCQKLGQIAAASVHQIVTVYDVEQQSIARQIQAHDFGVVSSVQFWNNSADNFVTGGQDGNVRLFDIRQPNFFTILHETPSSVLHVSMNPYNENQMAVINANQNFITILDTRQPK